MTAGDIYTVAGQEDQCTNSDYFGDGAPALDTGLGDSLSLTVDAAGDLFITDASEAVVREVAATSGNQYGIAMTAGDIYTLAGQANSTGYSATAGPAVNAQLSSPEGVAVDAAGDLLFADADNHVVRAIAAGSPSSTGRFALLPGWNQQQHRQPELHRDRGSSIGNGRGGQLRV